MAFRYFEKEGAIFRGKVGNPWVSHVKVEGEWRPYAGDRLAPVSFGDEITADEAGEREEEESRRLLAAE